MSHFFISLCALSGQLSVNFSVVWADVFQDALRSILAAMCIQGWSTTSVNIFFLWWPLCAFKVVLTPSWRSYIVSSAMWIQGWCTTLVKILCCGIRYVHSRLIYHFREDFILSYLLCAFKIDIPFMWKILYVGSRQLQSMLIHRLYEKNKFKP